MMRRRSPIVAALMVLSYAIAGVVAFWIVGLAIVVAFFNQSDEAWNTVTWFLLIGTILALPVGVLLAIGTYFKSRKSFPNDPKA
jgi:hypothetical protein